MVAEQLAAVPRFEFKNRRNWIRYTDAFQPALDAVRDAWIETQRD
jgi:hypothetical protein